MKAVGVCTEVHISPRVVTGGHRKVVFAAELLYFFRVSWHRWLILCLPCWFLVDGLECCRATAPGPFLTQGIDIQNTDF